MHTSVADTIIHDGRTINVRYEFHKNRIDGKFYYPNYLPRIGDEILTELGNTYIVKRIIYSAIDARIVCFNTEVPIGDENVPKLVR